MYGLSTINIELTSRCNKPGSGCFMCGRRKLERDYPEKCDFGDMPFEMVIKIAMQVPAGVVVQFHWNGEPLLYPQLGEALKMFDGCFRSLNTNGILLMEKRDEIVFGLETLVISIIQPDDQQQRDVIVDFLKWKKTEFPLPKIIFRALGADKWDLRNVVGLVKKAERHNCLFVPRILHDPMGSRNYEKSVTKPEIGVCLDLLHHLAIDRYGNVSPCVRFDPDGVHRIGNVNQDGLNDIWNSEVRKKMIQAHIAGKRDDILLCSQCEYWGCPGG